MKAKMIGIAKRDIEKGEEFQVPIEFDGTILPNKHINFIEGYNIKDLKEVEDEL